MKYSDENIAKNLAYWLKERNLTQKELAKRASLGETTIAHYLRQRHSASAYSVCALANALGIKPNDLLAERQEDDYHSELDNFVAVDGQPSKDELLAIIKQK